MSCDWPDCKVTTEISKLLDTRLRKNFNVCKDHLVDSRILGRSLNGLRKVESYYANDIFFETIWLHFIFNPEGFISKVNKYSESNGSIATIATEISKILNRKIKISEDSEYIGLLVGPSDSLLNGNLESVLTIMFMKYEVYRYTSGEMKEKTLVSHKFMISDLNDFEKDISQFLEKVNKQIDIIIYQPSHNDIVYLDPKNICFSYMTFILESIEISTDHYKGILPIRIENVEHLWNLFDETEYYEEIIEDTLNRLHTNIKSSRKE
jgi:hypothetical protein